jgi:photosystem II stability/assembly factor-like uncharacterized protein
MRRFSPLALLILLAASAALSGQAPAGPQNAPPPPNPLTGDISGAFAYRALGPARQCGRILHVAAHPSRPFTFYFSAASGGLWRTVNNGTTFESLLPDQSNVPIGHFAIAPSNPDVIWVGTGDAASGRVPFRGFGVLKSTDGGKTWKSMGRAETRHIGRIAIHPTNPDIVFVAAVGTHFTANKERGLYRTIDGGQTWDKVFDLGDQLGFVEVVIDPVHPDIVFTTTYDKSRVPWNFEESGPLSAVYKSIDGGDTWKKLTAGLPGGKLGRIGLAVYPKNPDIMYATIDNDNMRPPTKAEAERAAKSGGKAAERRIGGEIYRSEDAGETWQKMNADDQAVGGGKWYGQIYVDPTNDRTIYVPGVPLLRSLDGGRTWGAKGPEDIAGTIHVDHHGVWIDPADPNHIVNGHDGGLAMSYDFGKTWDAFDSLPLAQFYAISADNDEPYNIYGGLQDNGSVRIASNGRYGAVTRDDCVATGGGDGQYNVVDPVDSRWLYNASQNGYLQRVDQKLGTATLIRPKPEKGQPAYRFNWTAPVAVSPHNSQIVYIGAQKLLRSLNRGASWQEISPDLTGNDPEKLKGNIEFCTLTTVSESPLVPGLIWAGSDDGKVQLTRNGGGEWKDVTKSLAAAGGPEEFCVTRLVASSFKPGRAYAAKAGWHRDDYRPFVLRTDDFGETWTNITADLPEGTVYVVAEDRKNPDLLFAGTELGVYATLDGGRSWVKFGRGLPGNAMVTDLLIHPRENDLVVATHGRGLYITDITPLQEMREGFSGEDVHLFAVEPKVQWPERWDMFAGTDGDRKFTVPNEPAGLVINYFLKAAVKDKVTVRIADPYGEELVALEGKTAAGLNSVLWDMRRAPEKKAGAPGQPAGEGFEGRRSMGRLVPPGEYVVTLEAGGKKFTQRARIRPMPE